MLRRARFTWIARLQLVQAASLTRLRRTPACCGDTGAGPVETAVCFARTRTCREETSVCFGKTRVCFARASSCCAETPLCRAVNTAVFRENTSVFRENIVVFCENARAPRGNIGVFRPQRAYAGRACGTAPLRWCYVSSIVATFKM